MDILDNFTAGCDTGSKVIVSAKSQQNSTSPGSPIEILKKRYASGEIDDEEYERMKNDLEH